MDDSAAQVQACLHFLTEHGDGVQRFDSAFLHNLAAAACLTPAQLVIGARIARRYERQLEAAGLFVPAPEAIDAYLDAQKILAGKLAEEQREAFALSAHGDEKKNPNRIYLHHDRIIGNRLVVEFPFDRIKVAAVQPLKEAVDGWRFDYLKRKEWSYPFDAAARVIDALARFKDFEVGAGVTGLVAQCRYQETLARELAELEASLLEQEREVALEAIYPYLQGAPLADGHPLYQHQREAVRTLIVQQRCILAHDLGLGKTRSALIAAKSYGLSILVVAPAGLHINWQREAEAADVAIELISWAKMPEPPDVAYILIADEAHYAQSLDAQRTQAFLKLAEQAHAVFLVTGTPMKNSKPINLLPLLMAIRHPLAANRRLYEEYHCAGYYRKVGRKQLVYDTGGAAHLDELHRKIKDQVLFKKKEECLDLPPKIRMLRTAEVSSLALKEFQKTLERLRMEHNRRMQAKLEDRLQELLAELGEESELINSRERGRTRTGSPGRRGQRSGLLGLPRYRR